MKTRARVLMSRVMRLAPLAALFLLSGCAGQSLAARRAYLASFVGQSEAALVRAMGVPTRTFEANGVTFLAYDTRRVDVIPGFYGPGWVGPGFGPFGWSYPWSAPYVVTRGCQTTFEVKDGRVMTFGLHGPGCG